MWRRAAFRWDQEVVSRQASGALAEWGGEAMAGGKVDPGRGAILSRAESTEDLIITINGRIEQQVFLLPPFQLTILLPRANLLYRTLAGTSSQHRVIDLNLLGL